MNDNSMTDWDSRLLAQGVSPERIADAKAAARQMAAALETVTFAPTDPIAPELYLKVLAGRDET